MNIEIEGQGRPLQRLGYVVDDIEIDDAIGTQNGAELVRVHWLGDRDTPGNTRTYRLSSRGSWVDANRRLIYTNIGTRIPKWVDKKTGDSFDWTLPKPDAPPTLSVIYPSQSSEDILESILDVDVFPRNFSDYFTLTLDLVSPANISIGVYKYKSGRASGRQAIFLQTLEPSGELVYSL